MAEEENQNKDDTIDVGRLAKGCLIFAISVPFFLVGLLMIWLDADRCIVNANLYAEVTSQNIRHVRDKAAWVYSYVAKNGHLPDERELPRCRADIFFDDCLIENGKGPYRVKHGSYGVMFTPLGFEEVIYDSSSGKTDRDFLTEPWEWYVLFIPKCIADLLIGFAPYIFLKLVSIIRSRIKRRS